MKRMTIAGRIKRSVANRKKEGFFLRSDFSSFGSRSAVAAALKALTDEGFLIRISIGVYARTKWNRYAKGRVACWPLSCMAHMALERMGFKIELGRAARDYAEGRVTQIPQQNIYEIGNQHITRKFSLYGRTVYYERHGEIINYEGTWFSSRRKA